MKNTLVLYIDDEATDVTWEDNASVDHLKEICPVEVDMSMYGGFEQVGDIGCDLPADDEEITASPGEILLYQGDQIVLSYGRNSWSYTRLGHMDLPEKELKELLGSGDVRIRIENE